MGRRKCWVTHPIFKIKKAERSTSGTIKINQGILFDGNKIAKNPSLCNVAKLAMNRLWSKWVQRCNLTQTTIVSEPEEFLGFMFSGKYEIKYFAFLKDKTVMLQWS